MFRSTFMNFKNTFKRGGPQFFKNIQKQTFIVSSLLGASLYLTNRNYNNVFAQQAEQKQKQPIEQQEQSPNQIEWIEFSEDKYSQAVKEEPSRFKDSFTKEIETFLESVNAFQSMVKGRQIVFMKLEFTESKSMQQFINKYKVELEEETLFLFKNQYHPLTSFSFSEYFQDKDSVVKFFRDVPQLNQGNYQEFANSLDYLTSETTLVIAYCPKNGKDYEKYHKRFGALSHLKSYSQNKNVHFLLLNDEETAQKIGLKDQQEGDMFLVVRKSKICYNKSTHEINGTKFNIKKFDNLNSNMQEILKNIVDTYNEVNIFTSRSFDFDARYSLVLELDENRLGKQDRKKLIQLFSEFHQQLKAKEPELYKNVQFIYLKRASETKKWNIYVRDDYKYGLRIKLHSVKTKEDEESLDLKQLDDKPHSYQYNFPSKTSSLDVAALTDWLRKVQEGTAKESFKSSDAPYYRKFSKKLVGKTFEKEVQNNDRDQVVFFYSKHCHACKQYGHHYENLALEYLKKENKQVEFNRMNSDKNTLKTCPNFPYTPVFMVFKKGDKKNPYLYSSTTFTPTQLRTFIENTVDFKQIDQEKFNQQIEVFQKTDFTDMFEDSKPSDKKEKQKQN